MLHSLMNPILSYSLILAAGNIMLTLVGFLLGYQTDKMAEGRWFGYLSFVFLIAVTWLGIRAVREKAKDKSLSYGRGVGAGVLINLYAGVLGSIYGFLHFKFINPDFADYAIDLASQRMAKAGVGDAQIDAMEKGMKIMMSPVMMTIWGFIMSVLFGLLVALIVSAFLKRQPAPVLDDTPPAV